MDLLPDEVRNKIICTVVQEKIGNVAEDVVNQIMGGGKEEQEKEEKKGLDFGSLIGGKSDDDKGGVLGDLMSLGGKEESGDGLQKLVNIFK